MAAYPLIERLPRHLKMGELRVFVAVLEHRSFRKAAAAIHVTQPAVTKAIAALEEVLARRIAPRQAITSLIGGEASGHPEGACS